MKMRKVYLVQLIIIGTIFNITNIICCVHPRKHIHSKINEDISDREKRGSVFIAPYNSRSFDSNENAREESSTEIAQIQKIAEKNEGSKIHFRTKSSSNLKELIRTHTDKKNAEHEDTIVVALNRKVNSPRKPRQKNYMCYCEEADCHGKQCTHREYPQQSKTLSKQYMKDDSEKDLSAEEIDDYVQKVSPTVTAQPTKFNIPFANNVNFDQRVIVNNKNSQHLIVKQPPFYQTPSIKIQPHQQFSNDQYDSYAKPHPELSYTTSAPPQQNYVTPAPISAFKSDIPSIFGSNFPNIDDCIKLYGRTVCVISASSKPPPILPSRTSPKDESIENNKFYATTTSNPRKLFNNKVQNKVPTAYPALQKYQLTNGAQSNILKEQSYSKIINANRQNSELQNSYQYYTDKHYVEPITTALPYYSIDRTVSPYQPLTNINLKTPLNNVNPIMTNHQMNCKTCIENQKFAQYTQNFNQNKSKLMRTLTANIPKYTSKESIKFQTPENIDYSINNQMESNKCYVNADQNTQNIQSKDLYIGASNTYVPVYSTKEFTKNEYLENNSEDSKTMHDHSNKYPYMPQTTIKPADIGILRIGDKSKEIFNYQDKENDKQERLSEYYLANNKYNNEKLNNMKNLVSSKTYSFDYPRLAQNTVQMAQTTTPVYSNIRDFTSSADQSIDATTEDKYSSEQQGKSNRLYSVANNIHSSNYSSQEVVSSKNYEHSAENTKSIYTYSPYQSTPEDVVQSLNIGNLKLNNDLPLQIENKNPQQIKLKESYLATNRDYTSNYSSKETLNNESYESSSESLKPVYSDSPVYQAITQEKIQTIRSTIPNYNTSPSPNSINNNIQQVKSTNNLPIDPPKEFISNENYDDKLENSTPSFTFSSDFNKMTQNAVPRESLMSGLRGQENVYLVTNSQLEPVKYYENQREQQIKLSGYPADSNTYLSNHNLKGIISNENYEGKIENPVPSYVYSNDYDMPQNTLQTITARTYTYKNIGKAKLNSNQAEQETQYYKNNAENLKPIYAYTTDYANLHTNSPQYSSNSENLNYDDTTIEYVDVSPQLHQGNKIPISVTSLQNSTPRLSSPPYNLQQGIIIQPPKSYSIENANTNDATIINTFSRQTAEGYNDGSANKGNQPENIAHQTMILQDKLTDDYKRHSNPENEITVRAADNLIKEQAQIGGSNSEPLSSVENNNNVLKDNIQITDPNSSVEGKTNTYNKNVSRSTKFTKLDSRIEKHSQKQDSETLFRGIEKIILENHDVADSLEESTTESTESKESSQLSSNESNEKSQKVFKQNIKSDHSKILENTEVTETTFYDQTGNLPIKQTKKYMQSENNEKLKQQSSNTVGSNTLDKEQSTETMVQSVDDRPLIVDENTSNGQPLNHVTEEGTIKNSQVDTAQEITNEAFLQNAVKKVLNNFVPGKAQDLMANYGSENMQEVVGSSIGDLLPEIIDTPILKQLFSVPEIENMITDTASNFLTRITGLPTIGNIPHLIRNTLHNVIDQIPRPHPTVAPMTVPMTVEEHRYEDDKWVTERVSILQKTQIQSQTSEPPKEVYDKIRNIINKSGLKKEAATQPVVQNLIIKAVKHSLDKERGIIDEFTVRQAFDLIVTPKARNTSTLAPTARTTTLTVKKQVIVQPTTPTAKSDDDDYKIVPIIPVTEHILRGNGKWVESHKNLVEKKQKENEDFKEDKKILLQNKLDEMKSNKPKSNGQSLAKSIEIDEDKRMLLQSKLDELKLNKTNPNRKTSLNSSEQVAKTKEDPEKSNVVTVQAQDYAIMATNPEVGRDDFIERKPIKYYSRNDRILDYIKSHQTTDSPTLTTIAEVEEDSNEYYHETTTRQINERIPTSVHYNTPRISENPTKAQKHKPILLQSNHRQLDDAANNKNTRKPMPVMQNDRYAQQPSPGSSNGSTIKNNKLNLLAQLANGALKSESRTPINNESSTEIKTETSRQGNTPTNVGQVLPPPPNILSQPTSQNNYPANSSPLQNPSYLGKLVPLKYQKASQAKDLTDLQDSHLVYIGDGVRLPLTIRKMQDGSFALTLSDEMCKQFVHKKCPCCLPSVNSGMIMREKRNGEVIPALDFMDDELLRASQELENKDESVNLSVSRIRRESEEASDAKKKQTNRVDEALTFFRRLISLDKTTENNDIRDENNINDNDENKSANTKFSYQRENPILNELVKLSKVQNIRRSGPPYMYQQYADEDTTISNKTEMIRNMLHWMKGFVNKPARIT